MNEMPNELEASERTYAHSHDEQPPETRPELVFALVRAIGTDLDMVSARLGELLRDARWRLDPIRISDHFKDVDFLAPGLGTAARSFAEGHSAEGHRLLY